MDLRCGNIPVTAESVTRNEYMDNAENTKHTIRLGKYCQNHTLTQTHIQTMTNGNETRKSLRLHHCAHL
jgi:hypothetical protein